MSSFHKNKAGNHSGEGVGVGVGGGGGRSLGRSPRSKVCKFCKETISISFNAHNAVCAAREALTGSEIALEEKDKLYSNRNASSDFVGKGFNQIEPFQNLQNSTTNAPQTLTSAAATTAATTTTTSTATAAGGSAIVIRDGRPTFFFQNDRNCEIRAGGVLMYRKLAGHPLQILLIKNTFKGEFEDIGGKTDIADSTEMDTSAREADEESNKLLERHVIQQQIVSSSIPCYIKSAKYILYIIEADSVQSVLTSKDFGDVELYERVQRTVHWINADQYLSHKIKVNARLKSKEIRAALRRIAEEEDSRRDGLGASCGGGHSSPDIVANAVEALDIGIGSISLK